MAVYVDKNFSIVQELANIPFLHRKWNSDFKESLHIYRYKKILTLIYGFHFLATLSGRLRDCQQCSLLFVDICFQFKKTFSDYVKTFTNKTIHINKSIIRTASKNCIRLENVFTSCCACCHRWARSFLRGGGGHSGAKSKLRVTLKAWVFTSFEFVKSYSPLCRNGKCRFLHGIITYHTAKESAACLRFFRFYGQFQIFKISNFAQI